MKKTIDHILSTAIDVKQSLRRDPDMIARISSCVELLTTAFQRGNKIMFCGNGGSAADAQHLAAEFSGRFYMERRALPAEALHCNTSYLTAVGNDYSYDVVYARLVEGIGVRGDILLGLSTSGNSRNVVVAFDTARKMGISTVGFTGQGGGLMLERSDLLLNAPSCDTPRIQECHILMGHIICQLVEEQMFGTA